MLPGTALPLQTDLMLQYLGLMQSTALGKKNICKSPRWCWIPRVGSSKDCSRGGRQAQTWLMALLCSSQVDSSSVVFALYVCLGDLTQLSIHAQLQPASGTSKGCLLQTHWSIVRMAGNQDW